MERIGIAASKMAKGNLLLYNLFVVLIAFLCSLFLFIMVGSTIIFALIILAYVGDEVIPFEFEKNWMSILSICMVSLTVIIASFWLFALAKNLKFHKRSQ